MTNSEFNREFDILYNNIASNAAPGIDYYEKSVFLTMAQEQLCLSLYNSIGKDSFDETESTKKILSPLVRTTRITEKVDGAGLSKHSCFFNLPEDIWFITYETATLDDPRIGCMNGEEAVVVPVTQDEFYRIQDNPFRGPAKGRVLRLDNKGKQVELISEYNIKDYLIRYIMKPNPIIITDVGENLSINGVTVETPCELPEFCHRAILESAVQLAKESWKN